MVAIKDLDSLFQRMDGIFQKYLLGLKDGTPAAVVTDAVKYAITSGGKRLRPALMYLTYRSLCDKNIYMEEPGIETEVLYRFMTAIEMIHTSSLIHDDLPALDNDELRRGRPTVHVQFGEAAAILAGDTLLNLAYETAAGCFLFAPGREAVEKALMILLENTGLSGMLGGQSADVTLTGRDISEDELIFIYRNKTSKLIEAPLIIGGVLAGADNVDVGRLSEAGNHLGLAFQVRDDILDIISDEETLGKEVGQDIRNEKRTYVQLHGLEASERFVKDESNLAVSILREIFGTEERKEITLLYRLIDELIERKS